MNLDAIRFWLNSLIDIVKIARIRILEVQVTVVISRVAAITDSAVVEIANADPCADAIKNKSVQSPGAGRVALPSPLVSPP